MTVKLTFVLLITSLFFSCVNSNTLAEDLKDLQEFEALEAEEDDEISASPKKKKISNRVKIFILDKVTRATETAAAEKITAENFSLDDEGAFIYLNNALDITGTIKFSKGFYNVKEGKGATNDFTYKVSKTTSTSDKKSALTKLKGSEKTLTADMDFYQYAYLSYQKDRSDRTSPSTFGFLTSVKDKKTKRVTIQGLLITKLKENSEGTTRQVLISFGGLNARPSSNVILDNLDIAQSGTLSIVVRDCPKSSGCNSETHKVGATREYDLANLTKAEKEELVMLRFFKVKA